jgi:hypothetical protein
MVGGMDNPATFYTVTDAGFFPGTVALLNSLRLAGHQETLVVLDNGLRRGQRERLEEHVVLVDAPSGTHKSPLSFKPFPYLVGASGTIAIIDSDMIVSASLAPTLVLAGQGKICMYPDHHGDQGRWFAEWEELFSLSCPPRRQTYLNTGFVAFSVDHWPRLLEDWWEACSRIPADLVFTPDDQPFRDGDQDALNAILMTEIDAESVMVLPYGGETYHDTESVKIIDDERLVCTRDGLRISILHHTLQPKMWSPSGWSRLAVDNPYIRLFPRVVFGHDVVVRLGSGDVPWWLHPTLRYPALMTAVRRGWWIARPAVSRARRVRGYLAATFRH